MRKKISFLSIIFLLLFIFFLLPYYFFYSLNKKRKIDPKYDIQILIQTGPKRKVLKSMYLAELMGLCIDNKVNIYKFNTDEAEERLLKCPLIERAKVKKYPPNAVYVDYKVKTPIAWLYDLKNIAIDKYGSPFPISPFLPPQNLSEIYLGENMLAEGNVFFSGPIKNKKLDLALNVYRVLKQMQTSSLDIKRIDVSNAFSSSLGKREIVLLIDHLLLVPFKERQISFIFPRIIRLSVKDYEMQMSNYLSLHSKMISDYKKQLKIDEKMPGEIKFSSKVIDMRIAKLAFIDE